MKKKIKIEAYRHEKGAVEFFEEGKFPLQLDWGWPVRVPEFDIEKEIEVPDEERKPMELNLYLYKHDDGICEYRSIDVPNDCNPAIKSIELIPGHVLVSREMLAKAWDEFVERGSLCLHGESSYFTRFCQALGLGEK